MAKVLTESEVAAISYTSNSYEANRCCTKARAYTLGSTYIEPTDAVSNLLITKVKAPAKCNASIANGSLTYNGLHLILAFLSNIQGASSWYLCITTAYTIPATTNSTGVDWTSDNATACSASEAKTYYIWYRLVGDSNHTDIGVTYIGTKTISKANSSISFPTSSVTISSVGGTNTMPATENAGEGGAITYSSSDTSVATVNSSGTVTAKAPGSCTITAVMAATANYYLSSASYTLNVGSLSITFIYTGPTVYHYSARVAKNTFGYSGSSEWVISVGTSTGNNNSKDATSDLYSLSSYIVNYCKNHITAGSYSTTSVTNMWSHLLLKPSQSEPYRYIYNASGNIQVTQWSGSTPTKINMFAPYFT